MTIPGKRSSFQFFLAILLCCLWHAASAAQSLRGVNLAGAAYSPSALPGIDGTDYVYPNDKEIRYFTAKGMNVFRLSLLWERLQPNLNGGLDPHQLARLAHFITAAEAHGASVIIDVHNYGIYRGQQIGQGDVTGAAFANLWGRLAVRFGGDDRVLFGLMNEPKLAQPSNWASAVQQAVTAIRATKARNLILVSGTNWDSAQGFPSVSGASFAGLTDPQHRLIFEVHEYFNADGSGMDDHCVPADEAVARLAPFTQWLRAGHHQGFLGEFGLSRRPECLAVLNQVVLYLHANADVWRGWTYWAAGPAWGDYMFTLEPDHDADRPQMRVLEKYLGSNG